MKIGLPVLLLFLLLPCPAAVQADEALAPYQPERELEGTISIWGHGALGKRLTFVEELVGAWEEGFRKHQPGIRFDHRLYGTASAIGALYTGTGDLALMGREIWPPEIAAFKEVRGYEPTGIEVMTGSFDVRNKGYAIVVFVHKDNPIAGLDLAQLDAIYSVERRRGHAAVSTWGDLGLAGEWADQPVNLYGLPIARGFAAYLQDRIFLGSELWQPSLREFADDKDSVSVDTDGAGRMLAALAEDRHGIGYAGLMYHHPDTRPLPIAENPGDPFVRASRQSVMDRSYPLTRIISMFIDKPPGQPAKPEVEEFLRFILSREGQEIVEKDGGGYLPLLGPMVKKELSKLEQ